MTGTIRFLADVCRHPIWKRWAPCATQYSSAGRIAALPPDGDADRLGIIDDKGEFVHPNQILVILYYYLLKYKGWHGPAVRNIATTHLLDKVAAAFGEQCYEVPVGFKHISAKMLETNAVIGGESSGGLTVRGHIQGKDGIYAASLLVEMLAVTGKKLSKIYEEIVREYGCLGDGGAGLPLFSAAQDGDCETAHGGQKTAGVPL